MNNDLISRSALLEAIEKSRKAHTSVHSRLTVGDMEQMIKGAHSVDAEVVRHGRWVGIEYDGYADGYPVYDLWECSECRDEHKGDEDTLTPYCPNCGAKMDAEVDV